MSNLEIEILRIILIEVNIDETISIQVWNNSFFHVLKVFNYA